MKKYFDKLFVIHLPERKDRAKSMKVELSKIGWEYSLFPAIDGSLQNPVTQRMSGGRLGCLLSHLALLNIARDSGFGGIAVFEDDVECSASFDDDFNMYHSNIPDDWDMIYFGVNHIIPPTSVAEGVCRITRGYTSHAYIIRDTLYDRAVELLGNEQHPVDVYYSMLHSEINAYCFSPPLIWQRDGISDVTGAWVSNKKLIKKINMDNKS
ncbi:MAG: glycosyltransferase family 25 protein [Candidatus Methanoperedens sp.]|nr:glycosyltransferase family 25 protein [Candidatus Methanoperedens sp.]